MERKDFNYAVANSRCVEPLDQSHTSVPVFICNQCGLHSFGIYFYRHYSGSLICVGKIPTSCMICSGFPQRQCYVNERYYQLAQAIAVRGDSREILERIAEYLFSPPVVDYESEKQQDDIRKVIFRCKKCGTPAFVLPYEYGSIMDWNCNSCADGGIINLLAAPALYVSGPFTFGSGTYVMHEIWQEMNKSKNPAVVVAYGTIGEGDTKDPTR